MAPPKTLQEYQAEEAAANAQRLKDEQRARDEEKQNFFMKMLSGFMDNIGTIFIAVLLMAGLYFMAKNDKGDGLLSKIFGHENVEKGLGMVNGLMASVGINVDLKRTALNMEVDEFNAHFAKNTGIPQEKIKDILHTKAEKDELINLIADANGGEFKIPDVTNEKSLFALITQKPDIVSKFARAAMEASEGEGKDKNTATKNKVLISLRNIAGNEKMMDALLAPGQNGKPGQREKTLELISSLIKKEGDEPSLPPVAISFLTNLGIVGDKPTPALRSFAVALLTPDASGNLGSREAMGTALKAYLDNLGYNKAQQATTLVNMLEKTPGILGKEMEELITLEDGKPWAAFRKAFGNDAELMSVAGKMSQKNGIAQFALEHHDAFKAYADTASVEGLKSITGFGGMLVQLKSLPVEAIAPLKASLESGADLEKFATKFHAAQLEYQSIKDAPALPGKTPVAKYKPFVAVLLNEPDMIEELQKLGGTNVIELARALENSPLMGGLSLPSQLTPKSFDALLNGLKLMRDNPAMQDANVRAQTIDVAARLAEAAVSPNQDALKHLSPNKLHQFIQTHADALQPFSKVDGSGWLKVLGTHARVIKTLDESETGNGIVHQLVVNSGQDAEKLLDARDLRVGNGKTTGLATPENAEALLTTVGIIQNNPRAKNDKAFALTNHHVYITLAKNVVDNGVKHLMRNITPEQLSNFMADQTNSDAIQNMLAKMSIPGPEGEMTKMLATQHWETVTEMLKHKEYAALAHKALDNLGKPGAGQIDVKSFNAVMTAMGSFLRNPKIKDNEALAADQREAAFALVEYLNNNQSPMEKLSDKRFISFFQDKGNYQTVDKLLKELIPNLKGPALIKATAFHKSLGMLFEVGADPVGGPFLKKRMVNGEKFNPTPENCAAEEKAQENGAGGVKKFLAKHFLGKEVVYDDSAVSFDGPTYSYKDNVIGKNIDSLYAFQNTLKAADCGFEPKSPDQTPKGKNNKALQVNEDNGFFPKANAASPPSPPKRSGATSKW